MIERLSQRGVSVIYISHFLEECQRVASRFTVLRDGRSVGPGAMAGASLDQIIQLMVGRTVDEIYPRRAGLPGNRCWSCAASLAWPSRVGSTRRCAPGRSSACSGWSARGERRRCGRWLLDRLAKGSVSVFSREATRSTPAKRLVNGVGLLEDRKERAAARPQHRRQPDADAAWPGDTVGDRQHTAQATAAGEWMARLDVKALDATQPVGELSVAISRRSRLAGCCITRRKFSCWTSRRVASMSAARRRFTG